MAKLVGKPSSRAYRQRLRRRNLGTFHLTVVAPDELRLIGKELDGRLMLKGRVQLHGLGKRTDTRDSLGNEVFYVVATSSDFDKLRAGLGLPKRDLHITLGFKKADIHGVPKDLSTMIPRKSVTNLAGQRTHTESRIEA